MTPPRKPLGSPLGSPQTPSTTAESEDLHNEEPVCPNMVKVGWTRNNPALRANQLFTTGVPTPFVVEFMVLTSSGHDLERRIHNYLSKCRVNGSREFFNISVSDLRVVLKEKFSLTLIQLSDVIDQMPKIQSKRNNTRRNKWTSIQDKKLSELSKETSEETIENLGSMFDRFRYDEPLFTSNSSKPELNLDRFRYDGPLLMTNSSEPKLNFDMFRYNPL